MSKSVILFVQDFYGKRYNRVLKGERDKLKKIWETKGDQKINAPCPPDVTQSQWNELIRYWLSPDGEAKSSQMKEAQAIVINLNQSGEEDMQILQKDWYYFHLVSWSGSTFMYASCASAVYVVAIVLYFTIRQRFMFLGYLSLFCLLFYLIVEVRRWW